MTGALNWIDNIMASCPSGGIALYIRHGVRERGSEVNQHIQKSLTNEDIQITQEFGRKLSGRLGHVTSASGERSFSTAQHILNGAGLAGSTPATSRQIGDPSAYIVDTDALMTDISKLPTDAAIQYMLNGILRGPASWANSDPFSAALTIQNEIIKTIEPGKVSIFVAPNLPVAATVALAVGKQNEFWHVNCPGSLEGAIFYPEGSSVWLSMGSLSGRSLLG